MSGAITDIIHIIIFIKQTINRIKGFEEALEETTTYMTNLEIMIQNVANENRISGFDNILNEIINTLNEFKEDLIYISHKHCIVRCCYTQTMKINLIHILESSKII